MSTQQEHETATLAADLEAARKELELLAYSVSHDLRTPLRAIDGYSRMLADDYAERLDDNGRRMLGIIHSETQRLGRMIDAMLVLSRLGRQEMLPETIDMHELAQEVFDELAEQEGGRKFNLTLQPLPPAIGTRTMIRQLWEHLIGNAIKFTKGRDPAKIEIGAITATGSASEYFIKDNGVGFDMQLAEKLFGLFQRYHSEEEFPGIGLGLALVQRIVQRHGGAIRAEAEVDHGAAIFFTLPNPKP